MTAGTVDAIDIRKANELVAAKQAEAASAMQAFEDAKSSAIKEHGVEGVMASDDIFGKLDELGKTAGTLADEASQYKARRDGLLAKASTETLRDTPFGTASLSPEDVPALESFGKRFADSEVAKHLKSLSQDSAIGNSAAVKIASRAEVKTLLTTAAGGAALFRNDRRDNLVWTPQPVTNILDVIPMGETDSDTIEWVVESTWTNAAAETAEGLDAPESVEAFSVKTELVQEIVNSLPATKKMLRNAAQLESFINNRIGYSVRNRLQGQVVNGNGTAPNLRGILSTVGIQTQALGALSRADGIHKGITKIRIGAEDQGQPSHILINPTDWEAQALEKDANGNYYLGGPASNGTQTIWGLTPIISTQVAQGAPIVLDINQLELDIADGLTIAASDQHSDFFTKRKVMFLATISAVLAVYQPKAVCTVTGF